MKQWFRNLVKIKTDHIALSVGLISFLLAGWLGWYFSDLDLTRGNMGARYAYGEVVLYGIFVVAFVIFIAATVYQIRYFSKFQTEKKSNKKTGRLGGVGSFFSILVVGCPACSITLASYIGLASLMSLLPWHGMELKIIGALLVIWSAWSTVNKLETCQMKQHGSEHIPFVCLSCPRQQQKGFLTLLFLGGLGIIIRSLWGI